MLVVSAESKLKARSRNKELVLSPGFGYTSYLSLCHEVCFPGDRAEALCR